MQSLIPAFDFYSVFIAPWSEYLETTLPIVLMGFFVAAACGLVGVYVILRKMALVGDAISHSLLPGIAIGFLIVGTRSSMPLFLGAVIAGVLAVVFIEFIHENSIIKPDASIGIVFSSLFAIGVIIITLFADHVDLDTDCVLYGEIAFVPLEDPVSIAGFNLGPYPIFRMGAILIALLILVKLFFKELLVTTFDPGLARCIGVKPRVFHYGLILTVSLVLVSAFKSVGAILVVAMLLFPGCTALLLAKDLKKVLAIAVSLGVFYSVGGLHLATWLDCSIAAAMTVVAVILLSLAWSYAAIKKKLATA